MPEQHDDAPRRTRRAQPGPEGHRTLAQAIRGNRRSLELTGLILVLFLINFLWTSYTASRVTDAAAAVTATACDFWYPLTSLPVTRVAGQPRPTKLSVLIISGARESYAGQCHPPHPPLPPADPSLSRWAAFYHVPLP